jgi:hypothetical protein
VTEFVFRSSIDVAELKALERLVFFNPRQHAAESGITRGVELYGSPAIVAEADGLRVVVSRRKDVQCLFALAPGRSGLALAGMVVYLRTSVDEILVLHIAVAERFSRSRQSGLRVVMALVRAVREVAHRLRGVERLRMLYLDGRQFRVPIKTSRAEAIGDPAMACRAS